MWKLYDDDDVLYSLHSTPPPLSLTSSADNIHTKDVKMVIMWIVDGADCCLVGIVLGVTVKKIPKISSNSNNLQILPSTQLPNAIIVLTLYTTKPPYASC